MFPPAVDSGEADAESFSGLLAPSVVRFEGNELLVLSSESSFCKSVERERDRVSELRAPLRQAFSERGGVQSSLGWRKGYDEVSKAP